MTINSCLFLALGLVMQFVPAIAPGYFPPTGIVGSNGSELWLEFMGWVNCIVGADLIARCQLTPLLQRLVSLSRATWDEPAPDYRDLPSALPAHADTSIR